MSEEIVKVIRILEYEGPRSWVEDTLSKSAVPVNGTVMIQKDKKISSCILGQYPEIVQKGFDTVITSSDAGE